MNAVRILDKLSTQNFVILGGKETVGRGIAKLLWYS